ncbi:MAG: sodium pump decarboxylase subunit gamma [Clostridium sp.]|nr:sodium pump decarboxylase subunit gamma [Clostridium sp.]
MKKNIDKEIILVISAAVALLKADTNDNLVVKSFKRIPQTSPVWNTTGRIEQIGSNTQY